MSWAELKFVLNAVSKTAGDPRPLIADYFARGGQITRVPFAVSGYHTRARVLAAGRRGWVSKYGITAVPAESLGAVAAGLITLAEARVDLVWSALIARSDSAAKKPTLTDIGRALGLYPHQVAPVIAVLARDGFVQREARALTLIPRPCQPSWINYVRAA